MLIGKQNNERSHHTPYASHARMKYKPSVPCCGMVETKLEALVYDILPSTTAVFSYAIGSRKLSANEQFWVGAQTVVRLLQTTQITSDVCL